MLCRGCARMIADAESIYCTMLREKVTPRAVCDFYIEFEDEPVPEIRDATVGCFKSQMQAKRWPKDAGIRSTIARRCAENVMAARGYPIAERRIQLYVNEALQSIHG